MIGRLAAGLLGAVATLAAACPPAAAAEEVPTAEHVVVVGVPGLLWQDVTERGTPSLWSAAQDGSIGALTVRAARSTTCVLDGWVTLGAGNRARFIEPPFPLDEQPPPDPDLPGAPEDLGGCFPQERGVNLSSVVAALDQSPGVGDDNSYGAQPGALGTAVSCSTGVGRGPVLALHRERSDVVMVPSPPTSAEAWAELIDACPLTVVSLPELVRTEDRPGALGSLDARLGLLRAGLPADTELIVVGSSETGLNTSSLHVAIEVGPGVAVGYLSSASTQHTPYVQLIDVAPTALKRLGLVAPSSMAGQPFLPGQDRPSDLATAIGGLVDVDRAARAQGSLTPRFYTGYVVLSAALCLFGWWLLRLGRTAPVRVPALAVATLPAATFLANLVPWWRAGQPGLALTAAVAAAMALVTAVALGGPWRTARLGPAAVVAGATFLTLAADVLVLDSRLQTGSLLGYSPIVAGRFTGFGNIPFGLYAASALLVTVLLVKAVPAARRRLVFALTAVTVVVIDGTPGLGSDFGGVLALVPAYLVFGMLLVGIAPSLGRLALAGLGGAVVVMGIASLDYLRPADERTHLGRFVEQLLDGSAGTIVGRKASTNLDILTSSPLTLLVPVFGLTLWWLLRAGGLLAGVPTDPIVRAGLLAILIAESIGFVVNDSGVAVPVAGGWLVVPLALSVGATLVPTLASTVGTARSGTGVGPPGRAWAGVTVNSRDGTGREG